MDSGRKVVPDLKSQEKMGACCNARRWSKTCKMTAARLLAVRFYSDLSHKNSVRTWEEECPQLRSFSHFRSAYCFWFSPPLLLPVLIRSISILKVLPSPLESPVSL